MEGRGSWRKMGKLAAAGGAGEGAGSVSPTALCALSAEAVRKPTWRSKKAGRWSSRKRPHRDGSAQPVCLRAGGAALTQHHRARDQAPIRPVFLPPPSSGTRDSGALNPPWGATARLGVPFPPRALLLFAEPEGSRAWANPGANGVCTDRTLGGCLRGKKGTMTGGRDQRRRSQAGAGASPLLWGRCQGSGAVTRVARLHCG